jgi:phosphoribosylformylglycinamidine cyclo-ligase
MSTYAAAGVDIGAADENVRRIGAHVRSTHGPHVLGDFGAFGGLFHLTDVKDPVLVASTDGVGSKVLLGIQLDAYEVLGSDLVNLSVNDVLTTGARPLFFLDYVGVHALEHDVMERLVAGMAEACRENGCALLGGETAQLPELYAPGHLDLAGTVVGVVERDKIIDGSKVQPGDLLWGLPSTGLHTNGFTLARRMLTDAAQLEALMAPHPSYYRVMAPLLPRVKALAHITGGGIPGNLPRVLPADVSAELHWGAWPVPGIFHFLQEKGGVSDAEMFHVFNMGLGLIFVADPSEHFPQAIPVGRIGPRAAERVSLRSF